MTHQQILRWPEVNERVKLCRSRVYQLMDKGEFPKPINLSERAVGWLETEVTEWLNARIEARGHENG